MRYSQSVWLALALIAAASTGCDGGGGDAGDAGIDADDPTRAHWTMTPGLNRDLDVLFVVDNTQSMAREQAALAASMRDFFGALQQVPGGLPNLHVGIISSNVGAAGQVGIDACAGAGDDGKTLVRPGCTVTGTFLSDVADGGGNRIKNYPQDLDTTLQCMVQLGTSGCRFPMYLESMYRALQPGKNQGFYRPGAVLAVVIVADKDDCSTEAAAMFGDPTGGVNSPLGPLTTFRCHEFGVVCDADPSPRQFGMTAGCRPRPDSQYMFEIDKYEQFLKGLKRDPRMVVVAGILGTEDAAHSVVVGPDRITPTFPAVQPSCGEVTDPGAAVPPTRTAALLRRFQDRNVLESVCEASPAVVEVSEKIRDAMGNPCLHAFLRDVNPATTCQFDGTGCEFDCVVKEVRNPGPQQTVTEVPACPGGPPCWRLVHDTQQCASLTSMALRIEIDGAPVPPLGSYYDVSCLRP